MSWGEKKNKKEIYKKTPKKQTKKKTQQKTTKPKRAPKKGKRNLDSHQLSLYKDQAWPQPCCKTEMNGTTLSPESPTSTYHNGTS